jgi:hypothetical protein
MDQRPEQPPEGRLIAAATTRLNISIREAARRAGISYGRWRQITAGYQNVSPGSYAAVHAPARTLAKMAIAVNVTPERMETEGQRPDAARIMRDILDRPGTEQPAEEDDSTAAEVISILADTRDKVEAAIIGQEHKTPQQIASELAGWRQIRHGAAPESRGASGYRQFPRRGHAAG